MTTDTREILDRIIHRRDVMPVLRPHTWVAMYEQDEKDPMALGIVFALWPSNMTHLRFELTLDNGLKVYETATFHEFDSKDWDVRGQRFLVVPKRWCWNRLLREYRGLSAADL